MSMRSELSIYLSKRLNVNETYEIKEMTKLIMESNITSDRSVCYSAIYNLFSMNCFKKIRHGVYKVTPRMAHVCEMYQVEELPKIMIKKESKEDLLVKRIVDLETKINTIAAAFCAAGRNIEPAFQ